MMVLRCILINLSWIAWISLGSGVFNSNLSAQESTRDIRLIIDISSSLKKTDPKQLRQAGVSSLIDQLPSSNTQAGIWTFGKYVNMLVPLKPVTPQWRTLAKTRTRELSSVATVTNIGEALKIASAGWQSRKPHSDRHLILFTDGALDISSNPTVNQQARADLLQTLLPAFKQQQVRLHTIAFTATADHDLLQQLATQTGGSYQSVQRAEDLASALQFSLNKALAQSSTPASNAAKEDKPVLIDESTNKPASAPDKHQLPAHHAEADATEVAQPEVIDRSEETQLKKSIVTTDSHDLVSADALPTKTLSKETHQQKTPAKQIDEDIGSEENSFSVDANSDKNTVETETEDLENADIVDLAADSSEETEEEPIVHLTPAPKKTSFTESSLFKWIALSILVCVNLLLFGLGLLWYRRYTQSQQAQQEPVEDDQAESESTSAQPASITPLEAKKTQPAIKQPTNPPPAEPARPAVDTTDSTLEQTAPLLTSELGSAKAIDEEDLLDDPLKDLHIDDFDHQLDLPDDEPFNKPS